VRRRLHRHFGASRHRRPWWRVGIAPRLFLKKLVADVLDRVDQFAEFNPRVDYRLTVNESELTEIERNARAAATVDDVELDV